MPKSASSFAWMLIKYIAQEDGNNSISLSSTAKGIASVEDYLDGSGAANMQLISEEIGDGWCVIKTHADSQPFSMLASKAEYNAVFVQHRDPREISLSLLDHAEKSRKLGLRDFAECINIETCLPTIDSAMRNLFDWLQDPTAITISYNELCFDTTNAIERIKEKFSSRVSTEKILARFSDKTEIIQYNKGQKERYLAEMSSADSRMFIERYQNYYAHFGE
jgi:hypothetical protein